MAILVSAVMDQMSADRRRHPAIYAEAPSSAQQGLPEIDAIYLSQLHFVASSSTFRIEQIYYALKDQLNATARLQPGWDSYLAEAPTPLARREAERALEIFRLLKAEPAAVLPSADGGIGICFNNGAKYGQVEILNNGEAHALIYGGETAPQAWQIDLSQNDALTETWKRIGAHL